MKADHRRRPASTNTLDLYLAEIRGTDLLTAQEERDLAEAIAGGDEGARSRMIRANLRLVVRIARDYIDHGLTLDDLIGEGNLGLIRAAEEFDPAYNVRFSTYASYWIKMAIRHALTNTAATIRLPAHMVNLISRWHKAERAMTRELGREPSRGQVAAELGLTESQRAMVEQALRAGSLLREEGDGGTWMRDEHPGHEQAPDAAAEGSDDCRDLRDRLARLDARERAIVALRYGLDGGGPMTLKEVGSRMGITREWARRLERRALRELGASPPPRPAALRRGSRGQGQPLARARACGATTHLVNPSTARSPRA